MTSLPIKDRSMYVLYKFASQIIKEEHLGEWFTTPHELLGGKSPLQKALEGDEGWDRVEQMIASIIYGFPT
jgi:uncharacterized protein (DUF2384 family)